VKSTGRNLWSVL